jgi:hypothetical protein
VRPILANRKSELELFREMLRSSSSRNILLIEGKSGFGKTDLLNLFAAECGPEITTVRFDVRNAKSGPSYVFSQFEEEIGPAAFPSFRAELSDWIHGRRVNVSGNRAIGHQTIQVLLHSDDDETRIYRLESLKSAFFSDLRSCGRRIVALIDSYDQVGTDLDNWLCGPFLSAVGRTPQMIAVIAGQLVPAANLEWSHRSCRLNLEPIESADDWHRYACELGMSIEFGIVHAFAKVLDGHPLNICLALEKYSRKPGR